jgi:hypothetical protein
MELRYNFLNQPELEQEKGESRVQNYMKNELNKKFGPK